MTMGFGSGQPPRYHHHRTAMVTSNDDGFVHSSCLIAASRLVSMSTRLFKRVVLSLVFRPDHINLNQMTYSFCTSTIHLPIFLIESKL